MSESNIDERVARLEATVKQLEARVATLSPRPGPAPPGSRRAARPARPRPELPAQIKDPRYWFRILGIGLLLLGTVFIFKYSADESPAIMWLRVGVGAFMGLALSGIGFRLRHSERHFASVLSGGGIAIWYITGFASFQIFNLVPAAPAFAFMTVVTVFAFWLAVRQNVTALSVVGAMGGLGTPWLLYETERALIGPIAYMCLVLAGAIAVYAKKGWKALLWSAAFLGGGAFIAIGARHYVDEGLPDERMTMQVGFAFYWLLFAAAAVIHEMRARAARGVPDTVQGEVVPPKASIGDTEVFITLVAIYGVGMTTATWEPNLDVGGWVAIISSVAYLLVWRALASRPMWSSLAQAHLLSALVLVTTGIGVLLDGEVMIVALATEAAALHFLTRHIEGRLLPIWGHLVYAALAFVTLVRIVVDNQTGTPILNNNGLAHFWVIASAFAASFVMRSSAERLAYRYTAHGLILLWVLRELHDVPGGQGVVSIIWGLYAIALVVAGLRLPSTKLRVLGMVTLVLTVLKLVLVDLDDVEAIWRVLLFSGFGVVLLVLSHWSKRFGDKTPATDEPPEA